MSDARRQDCSQSAKIEGGLGVGTLATFDRKRGTENGCGVSARSDVSTECEFVRFCRRGRSNGRGASWWPVLQRGVRHGQTLHGGAELATVPGPTSLQGTCPPGRAHDRVRKSNRRGQVAITSAWGAIGAGSRNDRSTAASGPGRFRPGAEYRPSTGGLSRMVVPPTEVTPAPTPGA